MTSLPWQLRILLGILVSIAAYTDWRWRRIPNWLTIGGLAAGFVLQSPVLGGSGWFTSLGGVALAAAITLPLFAIRGLGGGDVKLMAAAGAMTGSMNFLYLFLINAILGGVAAIGLAIAKGRLGRTLRNTGLILRSLGRAEAPHHDNPDLGIDGEKALTLPRGVIFAVAAWLLLASGRL